MTPVHPFPWIWGEGKAWGGLLVLRDMGFSLDLIFTICLPTSGGGLGRGCSLYYHCLHWDFSGVWNSLHFWIAALILYIYFQIPHLSCVLGKGQHVVILTRRPLHIEELVVHAAVNPGRCLYKLPIQAEIKSLLKMRLYLKQAASYGGKGLWTQAKNVDAWTRKGILKKSCFEHRVSVSLILAFLSLAKMQMSQQPIISTAQLKCCNMQRGIL